MYMRAWGCANLVTVSHMLVEATSGCQWICRGTWMRSLRRRVTLFLFDPLPARNEQRFFDDTPRPRTTASTGASSLSRYLSPTPMPCLCLCPSLPRALAVPPVSVPNDPEPRPSTCATSYDPAYTILLQFLHVDSHVLTPLYLDRSSLQRARPATAMPQSTYRSAKTAMWYARPCLDQAYGSLAQVYCARRVLK